MQGKIEQRSYGLVAVSGTETFLIMPDVVSRLAIKSGDQVEWDRGGKTNYRGHKVTVAANVRKI